MVRDREKQRFEKGKKSQPLYAMKKEAKFCNIKLSELGK